MTQIVVNPEILDGKPIIEGTRLSVEHVLGLLASGMSKAEIIADYPELNEENIQAVQRVCFRPHISFVGSSQWSNNRSPNYP